jgi:hypothetical protein
MNKTTISNLSVSQKILINTVELQSMLSCGRSSAVKIGNCARAKVEIGRRVFWNKEKIIKYVDKISS